MMRHGFVPHGDAVHGNLCAPCDRSELTLLQGCAARSAGRRYCSRRARRI